MRIFAETKPKIMNHLPGSGNHMVDSDVGENKRPPLNSNDIYEEYLIERDMITHKDEKDSTLSAIGRLSKSLAIGSKPMQGG